MFPQKMKKYENNTFKSHCIHPHKQLNKFFKCLFITHCFDRHTQNKLWAKLTLIHVERRKKDKFYII